MIRLGGCLKTLASECKAVLTREQTLTPVHSCKVNQKQRVNLITPILAVFIYGMSIAKNKFNE